MDGSIPRGLTPLVVVSIGAAVRVFLAPPVAGQSAPNGVGGPTGRIVGNVLNTENGAPLQGAQVLLVGGAASALTNLDGRYVLQGVSAGVVDMQVNLIGFGPKTVTGVEVTEANTTVLNIGMEPTVIELEGITVSAERERGSTEFLLDQRRNASSMVESVGAAEISRRPDSDAASVAKRMTGVTVSDGKYAFVRGLASAIRRRP